MQRGGGAAPVPAGGSLTIPTRWLSLAWTMLADGKGDEGLHWASKAVEFRSNSYLANCVLGMILVFGEDPGRGRRLLEQGFRINPRGRLNAIFMGVVIISHYYERDYASALEAAKRVIAAWPEYSLPHRFVVAALGQMGRVEEAQKELQKALAIPGITLSRITLERDRLPHVRPERRAHVLEGLRKAGCEV